VLALVALVSAQDQSVAPITGDPASTEAPAIDPFEAARKDIEANETRQRSVPGAMFQSSARGPFPNAQLPASVVAPDGQTGVFADFAHAVPGGVGVPVYLVNRSKEEMVLFGQDGDLFFKLEFLDESGHWHRAQNHLDSWCGNSYHELILPPGQHVVLQGYLPSGGTKAKVRYRCYAPGGWTSNVGPGTYLDADRDAAEFDGMARREGPDELWETLTRWSVRTREESASTGELAAVVALRSVYGESKSFRADVERLLSLLPQNATGERKFVRDLLAHSWPLEPQPGALFERCLEIGAAGQDRWSEEERAYVDPGLAWRVLADLLRDPNLPDHARSAKRAFAAIDQAVKSEDERTLTSLARVLDQEQLADEHLGTERLMALVTTANTPLLSTVARSLVRRRETEWLANMAMKRAPEKQLIIFRALAELPGSLGRYNSGNRIRDPEGEAEREFWRHCARTQPLETVAAVRYLGNGWDSDARHFDIILHAPLREYLDRESKRTEWPDEEEIDALANVVDFLGRWKKKTDAPLFQTFLKHPGYTSFRGSSSQEPKEYESREYRVRRAAKDALIGMGEPVPEGVIIEEKIAIEPR